MARTRVEANISLFGYVIALMEFRTLICAEISWAVFVFWAIWGVIEYKIHLYGHVPMYI